jgi:hypothetical protein
MKVTKDMHEKIERLLRSITKADESTFSHRYLIFMSSITYPIENGDILNFCETIARSREERIEYIRHLVKVLKAI